MFAELLPVLAIAGVAIAIVYLLFNQLSSVPTKKSEAARVLQAVESQAKAAKTSKSPSSAKNMSKKEKAEAKKREEELDALVAKEALAPARGLAAEKYNVETLDDAKAKNKAKKEASKKSAGQAVAAAETKGPSEEQKAKDRAQGFKIVEEQKESSPVSAVAGATCTSRRPTAGHGSTPPVRCWCWWWWAASCTRCCRAARLGRGGHGRPRPSCWDRSRWRCCWCGWNAAPPNPSCPAGCGAGPRWPVRIWPPSAWGWR